MKHTVFFVIGGIICLIAVVFAGCLGNGPSNPALPPTPSGTPVQVGHIVVTEEQNTATTSVNKSSVITVKLKENPTTGFRWNLTTTPGLHIINDTYVPSDTTGKLVGSGGTRIWDISAADPGTQKITAVYMRSWEPIASNETAFSMTVIVA
jgi:inhibitor of cysteine peptidase